MEIAFVRVPGQRDRIYVHRSDGSEASWEFPTFGDAPPHDLVHLIVEAAFGLRRGFWGLVDSGVDPARINAAANRKGGADKYAGFAADLREILRAEDLAAAFSNPYSAAPPDVPAERAEAVRAAVRRAAAAWRAIRGKGALKMRFEPADPCAAFDSGALFAG